MCFPNTHLLTYYSSRVPPPNNFRPDTHLPSIYLSILFLFCLYSVIIYIYQTRFSFFFSPSCRFLFPAIYIYIYTKGASSPPSIDQSNLFFFSFYTLAKEFMGG
ncbi:hypothetical protein F4778DRAFT_82580 [Xylariomycetidae sp. FL2044]|nr:hypothetical protein F4778DRAFT_82580 [Xylariomycetidae sp. FL2044]